MARQKSAPAKITIQEAGAQVNAAGYRTFQGTLQNVLDHLVANRVRPDQVVSIIQNSELEYVVIYGVGRGMI